MDYQQQQTIESLVQQVAQLQQVVLDMKDEIVNLSGSSKLIFGRFRRGELIRMKDRRLYEGDGAPFESYNAVWNAKQRGCPFFRPATMRIWQITADDLEHWLRNADTKSSVVKLV